MLQLEIIKEIPNFIKIRGYGQRFWCKILYKNRNIYKLKVDNHVEFDNDFPLKYGSEFIYDAKLAGSWVYRKFPVN